MHEHAYNGQAAHSPLERSQEATEAMLQRGDEHERERPMPEDTTPYRTGNVEWCEQGSPAWHRVRLGKATGSRAKDVLTEPRAKAAKAAGELSDTAESYMLELVGEILTGQPANEYETAAMRWGSEHEAEARDIYEETMGIDVDVPGFVHHPTIPHVGCSPDGLCGSEGLLEIKCPFGTKEHVRTALSRAVPDVYVPQVQWNLWVTGRQWAHFVSYDPRLTVPELRLIVVPVERDEEMIARYFRSPITDSTST